MESDRLVPQSSAEPDDELYRLIVDFKTAREDGDIPLALRYIDRARRIAPDRPEINFLYGQLLIADCPSAALPFLENAAKAQVSAHFEAAVIAALVADGQLDRAGERLKSALTAFAVAPGGSLAKQAQSVTRELAPRWSGWVGIAPDLGLSGEIQSLNASETLSLHDRQGSTPLRCLVNVGPDGFGQFQTKPDRARPRRVIEARVAGSLLLGGMIVFPPDFHLDGRATLVDDRILGWVRIGWTIVGAVQILIAGHNGFRLRIATEPDLIDPGLNRFSIDSQLCADGGNRLIVSAMMPNGRYARLPDTPLLIQPPQTSGSRRGRQLAPNRDLAFRADPTIDVIIPAYKGVEETLFCIQSVMDTAGDAEIVVIEDASPEPRMAPALDALAAAGKITLLRNRRNAGFPRSVNRGFALHRGRDVVVLNSDTEVYGDWLDRLRAAAYGASDIGSVTPLTNSGSIASYPKSEDDCTRGEASERDRLAGVVNNGITVEIPTGVGFCLYLRRDCLTEIGYFDAIAFSHGYGEENDLCLRAGRRGWRHILATNVFVRHLGSRSFGARRNALSERNNRLINLRYPGYDAEIQGFLIKDPAHDSRRRLDETRLIQARLKHVLIVTLALDGGVRRAVSDRARFWRGQGVATISISPDPDSPERCLMAVDARDFHDLSYSLPQELPTLIGVLERLSIRSVELHHFLGLPPSLIEALFRLGPPVDVWAHDYVWYCPRVNLLGGGDVYCGEPAIAACEICVEQNGSVLGEAISVAALRDRSARWLSSARAIFAPSAAVARRLQRNFPNTTPCIQPLETGIVPRPPNHRPGKTLKIAVIGAIGVHKGYSILLDAANDAAARDLPIEFVVIGYTKDDTALRQSGKVFITGRYEESEVENLLAREAPHVALFASVFPETWCYALTHAVRAGLSIAAFDIGAIAERLRDGGGSGILFPPSATARELNDGLLNAFPVLPRPGPALLAILAGNQPEMAPPRHDGLADDNLPTRAQLSRGEMVENSNQLTSSVEILPLVKGLYLFSVGATGSRRVGDDHELILPALHVGLGPGTPPDHVEFMFGPRTDGPWLCEPRDHIVVKVKTSSTILLMTSIRASGMAALEIDVKRLDGPQTTRTAPSPPPKPADPPATAVVRALAAPRPPPADPSAGVAGPSAPLRVTVHVQRRGDMVFNDSQWAGVTGQSLCMESFSILPVDQISADLIEYKAVTASGIETPWITGGAPCGTRGMAMPLVGFAVRLKPLATSPDYVCEYSAVVVSGAVLGPARDGAPCRSVDVGDPIEAIWVSIRKSEGGPKLLDHPPSEQAGAKLPRQKPVHPPEPVGTAQSPKARGPIGPRFSVFRDPVE